MKQWVRLALAIYFKKITFSNNSLTSTKGPAILACNHPNSFLDAIILEALFERPVYSLVRGDAFKKPFVRKIFTALKMIPIYRLSEGKENLGHNDATFEKCAVILKQGGIILIFSEGLSIHEWILRPLKKGTARIALQGFQTEDIGEKLSVIPVGLNYSSFTSIGKYIYINEGSPIYMKDMQDTSLSGAAIVEFTQKLNAELLPLVLSQDTIKKKFVSNSKLQKYMLFIPAIIGYLIAAPLYYYLKKLAIKLNKGGIFYDSMLFGFTMLLYPIYLLIISTILVVVFHENYLWFLMVVGPLTSACATRVFGEK